MATGMGLLEMALKVLYSVKCVKVTSETYKKEKHKGIVENIRKICQEPANSKVKLKYINIYTYLNMTSGREIW